MPLFKFGNTITVTPSSRYTPNTSNMVRTLNYGRNGFTDLDYLWDRTRQQDSGAPVSPVRWKGPGDVYRGAGISDRTVYHYAGSTSSRGSPDMVIGTRYNRLSESLPGRSSRSSISSQSTQSTYLDQSRRASTSSLGNTISLGSVSRLATPSLSSSFRNLPSFNSSNSRSPATLPSAIPSSNAAGGLSSGTNRPSLSRAGTPSAGSSSFSLGGSIAGSAIAGAVSGVVQGGFKLGATSIITKHQASENQKNRDFKVQQRDWAAEQFTKHGLPSYLAISALGSGGGTSSKLAGPLTSQHTSGQSYYSSSLPGDPRTSGFTGSPMQQHMGWGAI